MAATNPTVHARQPSERREWILNAAIREFAEKGIAGARVDQIAARSNTSKQLIYHYYESKSVLFEAALVQILERTNVSWRGPREPLRDQLRTVVLAQERAGLRQWRRMMMWEAFEFGGERIPQLAEREAVWALRTDRMRAALEAGELDHALEPRMLTLMELSLALQPHAHPQTTKLITGLAPGDEAFRERQLAFVDRLATHLARTDIVAPAAPPRAPRRRRDAARPPAPAGDRRQRILDVATLEFARSGIAGARVDHIAALADANKQLIYHYFGSKAKLFDAVLASIVERTAAIVPERAPGSYREHLREVVLAQELGAVWEWRRMMGWEALESQGRAIADERQRAAIWAQRVDAVRRAQGDGELDPGLDPEWLTLFGFSIAVMPHVVPQLTRVITGALPDDSAFRRRQLAFVDRVVTLLAPR